MTRRATHLRAPRRTGEGLDVHRSACGLQGVDLVDSHVEVTCRKCAASVRRAVMSSRKKRGEYMRALMAHVAEGINRLAEEAEPEPWTPPPPQPVTRGVSELGPVERAIVARSVRGDDAERKGPRFTNLRAAVQRWAAWRDEGASLASSSAPGRFEGMPRGTREGRVSNVERPVDDVVGVERAISAAFVGGMTFGDLFLAPNLCREIWTWRHAGKPVHSSKRRECVQRHDVETSDLVTLAALITGREVTPRQIALVVRRGNAEVRAYLERTGELAARKAS